MVIALVVLTGSGPAGASSMYVLHAGSSISMQRLPAVADVTLTAVSSTPITRIVFSVAGSVVGQSSAVDASSGLYRVTTVADLRGLSGKTDLRTVFYNGRTSSTVSKTVLAVAPASAPPESPVSAPDASTPIQDQPTESDDQPLSPAPVETAVDAPSSEAPPELSPAPSPPDSVPAPAPAPAPAPQLPAPSGEQAPEAANSPDVVGTGPLLANPVPPSAPGTSTPLMSTAGPDTTGVPSGALLTPVQGDMLITTDGTVLDGVDLTGCITIRAHDVVIKNSRITCSSSTTSMVVATNGSYRNLVVQDSELDGTGTVDIGIGWQNYSLSRVEIRGTNDGARAGSNTTVDSSWIHAMTRRNGLHPDSIQSTGGTGIRITNNFLDPRNDATGDQGNAAIMLGSELRPFVLQNVFIAGNTLSAGNYSINVRADTNASNIVVQDNVFNTDAKYGAITAPLSVAMNGTNVLATGRPVSVVPAR